MTVSEKMVLDIVVALCAHYAARERAIADRSVGARVRMEYIYINAKMYDAAAETVGQAYAKAFIMDIGMGVGYANTKIDAFSELSYKKSKMEIKRKIAERLHLLDTLPDALIKNKK